MTLLRAEPAIRGAGVEPAGEHAVEGTRRAKRDGPRSASLQTGEHPCTGNLREVTTNGGVYTLMGGAFNSQSEDSASCDHTFYAVDANFKLFDMGFRCCYDVNPM